MRTNIQKDHPKASLSTRTTGENCEKGPSKTPISALVKHSDCCLETKYSNQKLYLECDVIAVLGFIRLGLFFLASNSVQKIKTNKILLLNNENEILKLTEKKIYTV